MKWSCKCQNEGLCPCNYMPLDQDITVKMCIDANCPFLIKKEDNYDSKPQKNPNFDDFRRDL